MAGFRRDYRNAIDAFGATYAGSRSEQYVGRVESALDEVVSRMHSLADNQKGLHYAKGDVAEAWHEGTFNVDSVRVGGRSHAVAPRDASAVDVRIDGPAGGQDAQLKYYRSGGDTARAISDPKYSGMDQKVVPSDQLDAVRETAANLAIKNSQSRPQMSENYAHTSRSAADRLRADGIESKPLDEKEAQELVKQLRRSGDVDREGFGLTPQQIIQWQDILRESTTAATRAAVLSAVLQTAPHLVAIARKAWETGEISGRDFLPLAKQLPVTLLRSGVAGGLSAAVVATARAGMLGSALQQVDPTFVAAGVTLAMNALETSVQAALGRISWKMASVRIAEDSLVLAASMAGAVAGQALIPIPMLGALVGNVVGAAMARLAIDQAEEAVLGLAVETGWTFFGLVDQDHAVPRQLLESSGWNLLDLRRFEPQRLELRRFEPRVLELQTIRMHMLRRGVLGFGRVGYLS